MGKYKFVNGVMVLDAPMTKSSQVVPLAVACTPEDLAEATMAAQANNMTMHIPVATQVAIEEFSKPEFMARYKAPRAANLDGDQVLDAIAARFSQYEIPIGLLSKLLGLVKYKINFIIDDSGSMGFDTDSKCNQAAPYMIEYLKRSRRSPDSNMTRWEEAEDRLHTIVELLAYIPTEIITISFLNRPDKIMLDRSGKVPEQILDEAHDRIRKAFTNPPYDGTPTLKKLKEAFSKAYGYTMHYLFTDGVPNGGHEAVADLVLKRANPEANPLTFVSCTNVDGEAKWMKEIEEKAPFTAETDDYADERGEVLEDQGPVFPYPKGLWLVCLMVGAINPDDLDAIDDSRPFSKFTMSNILGRVLTDQEYRKYWDTHPKHGEFSSKYTVMANEQKCTREILGPTSTSTFAAIKAGFKRLSLN